MKHHYRVTINVQSREGSPPKVRTLCGDTVFVNLAEGQTAAWAVKRTDPPAVTYTITDGKLVRLHYGRPVRAGPEAVQSLAEDAIDVAARFVQDALGATHGDVAGQCLDDTACATFRRYVRAEVREAIARKNQEATK